MLYGNGHRAELAVSCGSLTQWTAHPDGLGWLDLSRMFVLYGETFDVRV